MATSEGSRDGGEANFSDLTWEQFRQAQCAAFLVTKALQSQAPFTPEDIERIKDHVSPNGVAYQNGFKAGQQSMMARIAELEAWHAESHQRAMTAEYELADLKNKL